MPDFSVVTIVKGRRKQLNNLLQSIKASTVIPRDVQIVFMDEPDITPVAGDLPIHSQSFTGDAELPLAAARNMGFAAAKADNIIFVDVDCIVSPTLFENVLQGLTTENIVVAYPLYLPIVPNAGDYTMSRYLAVNHPARVSIPAGQPIDHLQFWSIVFGIQRQTFEKIGGFDESFIGYGAEDTDFAMRFHRSGIRQVFVDDYVLHQHHEKHDPPLNYFHSIIKNAVRYREKWGVFPMGRWLRAFENMGLIRMNQNTIQILKHPAPDQIAACASQTPY